MNTTSTISKKNNDLKKKQWHQNDHSKENTAKVPLKL